MKKEEQERKPGANAPGQVAGVGISVRSFLTALIMLFGLMVLTWALTFVIPGGEYQRILVDGTQQVLPDSFAYTAGRLPFWKWLLSPFLCLGAEGGGTMLAIIVFLLVIGGVFHCMDKSGLMHYMLLAISHKYESKKYRMLCLITLFFMCMGSFVGSFEESVPLVPIAVGLAVSMGWDAMVGLGMSLLAIGCGFATGICNPFTVGVAQQLSGLVMFSGAPLRMLSFALVYGCLIGFLLRYAKRIEGHPERSVLYQKGASKGHGRLRDRAEKTDGLSQRETEKRAGKAERSGAAAGNHAAQTAAGISGAADGKKESFVPDRDKSKGLWRFGTIMGVGILLVFISGFIPFLQGIIMPLIAVLFLSAGLCAVRACRMEWSTIGRYFKDGAVSLLPAILLILMAGSIRYTLVEAKILDTILYGVSGFIETMPKGVAVLLLYAFVLLMNFFIASGSAKAFLMMPLIVPIADFCGISRQLGVLAFAFGDGFSNVFYFTNPVLLISLGLVGVSYTTWARWSAKIQGAILVLTGVILLAAA